MFLFKVCFLGESFTLNEREELEKKIREIETNFPYNSCIQGRHGYIIKLLLTN